MHYNYLYIRVLILYKKQTLALFNDKILGILFIGVILFGCKPEKHNKINNNKFLSTGGVVNGKIICPSIVNDLIVPLNSLNPTPKKGEPKMTIDGIRSFIKTGGITTITELLNRLPIHYKTNFSLVEKTKGEGQSSLKFPRIVLFGSDGRFLVNVSTKPDDPKFNLLDCAELSSETGKWEFSQFDFTNKEPKFHKNPESCIRCHGEEPRPVWGTNMDWPGVFGDNEAAGPNGEALSYRHVLTMNEIKKTNSYSDRFDFLLWSNQKLTSGGIRRIANNAFGAELLVSNLAMGSATARGVFLRLKKTYPKRYKMLREELLLLGYEHMVKGTLSKKEKNSLNATINSFDKHASGIDGVLKVLGVDTNVAFSLGTLDAEEKPQKNWSLGAGDLYEQVFLQVLNDLLEEDKQLENLLLGVENTPGIFGCDNLGKNIKEVIDFKMLHLFYLQGSARYEVNKVYYPQDIENIKDKVFVPIYEKIKTYLKTNANII